MAFLKKALKWLSPGVEPSEEKKQQGFQNGEFPSAGHFDFMFKSTADAIEELQQKAGEVKTVNGQVPNANGNIDVSIETNTLATKEELTTHKSDNAKHGVVGVATGTNTLAMTSSDVTAYTDMMLVAFKNTTESTGATTLNINGLGAKAILKANGGAVTNLKANAIYQVRYNGTSFILLGEGGGYGTATASDVLVGKTIGTENGIINGTLEKGTKTVKTTIVSSSEKMIFRYTDNSGNHPTQANYVTFSGLTFIPSKILMVCTDATEDYFSLYKTKDNNARSFVALFNVGNSPSLNSGYSYHPNAGNAYVTSTGFRLPFPLANKNVEVTIYE